ncbi:uncharacterized protein Z519_03464 [Cladophialophora bantiana CBS 173.52]|uniref:Uncharacterized protein n=1 Tax=Cladophialophora bantiana (strain ATCC 10958 / CBS 173.52 / CDC B-1940 / NIH 8579) TaxID=1442370 RepID=A0A0D2HZP5_CLAB1|nr:uncharacterized protein Z519_03464 [Cladophialophora bantiana CBS 173.52]KIW96395.1 hypothetical protein Z519_03464 [Cladophialophora bantiana CBS 173.52]
MMCMMRKSLFLLSGAWLVATALAANLTVYQSNVSFVPVPLPVPGGAANFEAIIEQFTTLGRTTVWRSVKNITFQGDTGEPEGMVVINEERFITARGDWTVPTTSYNGTIINGTDRTPGAGYGHIEIYDGQGKRVVDATLTPPGDIEYHIGGLDYDGQYIWATLAQYRPNTTATIIAVNPLTLEYQSLIHYADHLGGIVHDTKRQRLNTLNWGSRNASIWNLNATSNKPYPTFSQPSSVARNPSFYVDYQDCKFLGHSKQYDYRAVMICSGVATLAGNITIGGLALVDFETMIPLYEVPLTMTSVRGTPLTQNPFDVAYVNETLRFYFLPDQHNSTLYIYEPLRNSPYEY